MNEMKAKAIEKLMSVLDEVLGEDVVGRLKQKVNESTESSDEDESEESEENGKEVASGGASIMPLPEPKSEEDTEPIKPKGVGMEVSKIEVAAMPRSGLMKRLHGGKKPA